MGSHRSFSSSPRPFLGLIPLVLALSLSIALANAPLPLPGGLGSLPPDLLAPGQGQEENAEEKRTQPDYRVLRAPLYERINPRLFFDERGVAWPYAVVSRQDIAITNLMDPDCPSFNLSAYFSLVQEAGYEEFRPWPNRKPDGQPPTEDEKWRALRREAEKRRDGACPQSLWYLPLSSLRSTQEVAGKLKRAWERFEDRYFWRVVTDVNNPVYWFAYCVLGLGFENYSQGPRPDQDFIPPGILPPELGGLLTRDLLDLISEYKGSSDSFSGARTARANYRSEAAGKFRKPLYLPFVPTIAPREFCDGMGFKLPIFYIPAIEVRILGIPVWASGGYPDFPMIFDQGEADRRIQGAMAHAMSEYYAEYLARDVLLALIPGNTLPDAVKNLTAPPSCGGDAETVASCLNSYFQGLEAGFYFPVPWQAPVLGGGAVVTPVFEYAYPDLIRTGIDILTIYDMVAKLLGGESLSSLEKAALALYYLQPLLNYLDLPLIPGFVDMPVRDTPIGQAIEALYGVVHDVVKGALEGFLGSIEAVGERAFGPEKGAVYVAGVRILFAPVTDLFAAKDPRFFVSRSLFLLRQLDEFLRRFTGQGADFRNVINGVPVAPGLWRFEELKRTFPASNVMVQRMFGYGSFFAAWNQLDATTIPDLGADWANAFEFSLAVLSRVVGFWHLPIVLNFTFTGVEIIPQPPRYMPLAPYLLPFVGERTYWGWFSLPEGYPMPLVKGIPGTPLPALGAQHPLASYDGSPGLLGLYERFLGQEAPRRPSGGGSSR